MKTESQVREIKNHLLNGGKLTGLDALKLFGTMRLPSRIWDIKQLGVAVVDEWVKVGDKRVKQYFVEGSNGA